MERKCLKRRLGNRGSSLVSELLLLGEENCSQESLEIEQLGSQGHISCPLRPGELRVPTPKLPVFFSNPPWDAISPRPLLREKTTMQHKEEPLCLRSSESSPLQGLSASVGSGSSQERRPVAFCRSLNIYSKKKHRTLEHLLLVNKCVLKFLWLFRTHTGDIQSVFII